MWQKLEMWDQWRNDITTWFNASCGFRVIFYSTKVRLWWYMSWRLGYFTKPMIKFKSNWQVNQTLNGREIIKFKSYTFTNLQVNQTLHGKETWVCNQPLISRDIYVRMMEIWEFITLPREQAWAPSVPKFSLRIFHQYN